MTQDNFLVRPMTLDELKLALSWAEAEGWNPGIDDANNFYIADPKGFLIGELNGEPISSISVVKYHSNFNFIGLYIVKPEWRKQGFGLKTWQEALKLINNQPAALDGVIQQVDNYRKFGFNPSHTHYRYQGVIQGQISQELIDLKRIDFEQFCRYDNQYFPALRPQFLQTWINQPNGCGYGIIQGENLVGYGVIRQAIEGFKIGPLFADYQAIAEQLLLALATYANGKNIYLDVPNINQQALALAERYQMKPVFECVRMYTHQPPSIDWTKVFGVTTLELG